MIRKMHAVLTKARSLVFMFLLATFVFGFIPVCSEAAEFKIIIMQDKKGAAKKFLPLIKYLKQNGVEASFATAKNYTHAARMFAAGRADAMFSGSGVAGSMIIKELAYPLVRPVHVDGWSTYWAVVLAQKGSGRFKQSADYFRNKDVMFCSLASSGEFYFRSITDSLEVGAKLKKASSHGAAINALSKGAADIAIVKNRVWDSVKDKYPDIIRVGEDPGENPNGTLIVSKTADKAIAKKVKTILLAVENDNSPQAKAVKRSLKISGYIDTTLDDFQFTIAMLKKAGVSKRFNFVF